MQRQLPDQGLEDQRSAKNKALCHQSCLQCIRGTGTRAAETENEALTSTGPAQDFHKSALMFPIINIP